MVWEHNTHIGDARFTAMSDAGMVNVGQLVRQRYGEPDTVLVGFASHHGSVVDETTALNPLRPLASGEGELEVWPFGA
ncbi:erythromycin esterase family protein [Nocardioides sp. NPDC006273]|uniref:erythromycin esterase family protein n=1 Tax=Nocardioides sp. NPDC006273 TaxID=3155598 RepID=UPI0033AD447F